MTGMPQIEAVGFWLGGTLVESLPEACARICFSLPIEKLDIQPRLRLHEKANELALGHLSSTDFCQQVIDVFHVSLLPDAFEAELQKGIQLWDDVLAVMNELPSEISRWVICDYPRAWCRLVLQELETNLPKNQILFTTEVGIAKLIPDLFYEWAQQAHQSLNNCMLVSQSTVHNITALQHGLQASVFVDARRLKRDFVLRRMLPPPFGFSLPGSALPLTRRYR